MNGFIREGRIDVLKRERRIDVQIRERRDRRLDEGENDNFLSIMLHLLWVKS